MNPGVIDQLHRPHQDACVNVCICMQLRRGGGWGGSSRLALLQESNSVSMTTLWHWQPLCRNQRVKTPRDPPHPTTLRHVCEGVAEIQLGVSGIDKGEVLWTRIHNRPTDPLPICKPSESQKRVSIFISEFDFKPRRPTQWAKTRAGACWQTFGELQDGERRV